MISSIFIDWLRRAYSDLEYRIYSIKRPAFILNLALWTRRLLFNTQSFFLELFSHEAMVFLHFSFTDICRCVIFAAYYTFYKYFRGLFKTSPWRPGVYSKSGLKLRLMAHSRSFLANQKARNAIAGAENLKACYSLDLQNADLPRIIERQTDFRLFLIH